MMRLYLSRLGFVNEEILIGLRLVLLTLREAGACACGE